MSAVVQAFFAVGSTEVNATFEKHGAIFTGFRPTPGGGLIICGRVLPAHNFAFGISALELRENRRGLRRALRKIVDCRVSDMVQLHRQRAA